MTAITTAAPAQIRNVHWFAAAALVVVMIALTAYVVARVTSSNPSTPAQTSTVQTGQYNQLCAPAPGTRYC